MRMRLEGRRRGDLEQTQLLLQLVAMGLDIGESVLELRQLSAELLALALPLHPLRQNGLRGGCARRLQLRLQALDCLLESSDAHLRLRQLLGFLVQLIS